MPRLEGRRSNTGLYLMLLALLALVALLILEYAGTIDLFAGI
jgi:hypothetical protein